MREHGSFITLKTIPNERPQEPPAKEGDDGIRVGQVWRTRARGGNAKILVIFRLTPMSTHTLRFDAVTGEFLGTCAGPARTTYRYGMEKVGRVRNLPDVFAFDVEWFGEKA